MAATTGKYIGLDSATLATMKTNAIAAHAAALSAQSYSIAGRTKTAADLRAIGDEISEISFAQSHASGSIQSVTYPDMSNAAG